MAIEILSPAEIQRMRRAGEAAAQTLAFVGARLRAGMSTLEIDRLVREDTARRGGQPSQLGYEGFPASVCTSRNDVVCHGIPSPTFARAHRSACSPGLICRRPWSRLHT